MESIAEYLSFKASVSGIYVTARVCCRTVNPLDSIADVKEECRTITMPWSSYRACLGAKERLETKYPRSWDRFERLEHNDTDRGCSLALLALVLEQKFAQVKQR
jgi:hypothetical protein